MKLLLDTHVFLWLILNDPKLTEDIRVLLRDPSNEVYLSVISVWEACLKYQLGKLPLPEQPSYLLPTQRVAHQIGSMPVTEHCMRHLQHLP
jgi:PIN domain nuclease of toxin-antitoxin system